MVHTTSPITAACIKVIQIAAGSSHGYIQLVQMHTWQFDSSLLTCTPTSLHKKCNDKTLIIPRIRVMKHIIWTKMVLHQFEVNRYHPSYVICQTKYIEHISNIIPHIQFNGRMSWEQTTFKYSDKKWQSSCTGSCPYWNRPRKKVDKIDPRATKST